MKFKYFKKPNGQIVKRQLGVAIAKADEYKKSGYKECDKNGKLQNASKKKSGK
tara:strand:+ start:541 stop:699 length:159 start_codon:yes stop_codon:yes gene_type:complete